MNHVTRLNLIRDSLLAHLQALPAPAAGRIVTRDYRGLDAHSLEDRRAGIYNLVLRTEDGYPNYNGMEAMDGKKRLFLMFRAELPESCTGQDIEDLELNVLDTEVAPWLRTLPQELCCLLLKRTILSGQVLRPIAQVFFELVEECD